MYHLFLIHPSVNGHLGCFHVLAIVNSAAMNIGIHMSFWIMVFWGYLPGSGISGLYFGILKDVSIFPIPQKASLLLSVTYWLIFIVFIYFKCHIFCSHIFIYLGSFLGLQSYWICLWVFVFHSTHWFLILFFHLHQMTLLVTQVMSDSLWPHVLQPTRLLCPWDSPGQNTGVGGHSLLQGIFLTQGWNSALQANSLLSEPPGKPQFHQMTLSMFNMFQYLVV